MSDLVQCGMNSSSSPSRHLTSDGLDEDEDISTKILGPSASLIPEDIIEQFPDETKDSSSDNPTSDNIDTREIIQQNYCDTVESELLPCANINCGIFLHDDCQDFFQKEKNISVTLPTGCLECVKNHPSNAQIFKDVSLCKQ